MINKNILGVVSLLFLFGAGCSQQTTSTNMQVADTSNTKTYVSAGCGFSFDYPSNLVIDPQTETVVGVRTQEDLDFQNNQDGEVPPFFNIYATCLPNMKTLVSQGVTNPYTSSVTNLAQFFAAKVNPLSHVLGTTMIDGETAYEVREDQEGHTYTLYMEHQKKIYTLSFSENVEADKEHLTDIQQTILASFTFTN